MPPEASTTTSTSNSADKYREDATPAGVINPRFDGAQNTPSSTVPASTIENSIHPSTLAPETKAEPQLSSIAASINPPVFQTPPPDPKIAPKEEIATKYIAESLQANQGVAEGLGISDLANRNSPVYKAPEVEKRPRELPPEKPKFDVDGLAELVTLRTYHGDVAEAVKGGSLSMIKVAAQEQGRRRVDPLESDGRPRSLLHIGLILGASLLFVAGVSAVVIAWISKSAPVPITQTQTVPDVISADSQKIIDITGLSSRDIQNSIDANLTSTHEDNTIEKLVMTELEQNVSTTLSSGEVLQAIGANVPDVLGRSLSPDKFMLGVWNGNGRAEPFLILTTTSDQTAFPGMLQWENNLAFDMEPLMGPQSIAAGNTFVDQIIQNHDARALTNANGTIFFYTVVNNNIIVIAKSGDALSRILEELRESELQ